MCRWPRSRWSVGGVAALAVFVACTGRDGPRALPDGAVLVAEVLQGGGGEAAGLRAGDRLLRFRRLASATAAQSRVVELGSCIELARLEIEEAPRGAVEFDIERGPEGGRERRTLRLPADDFRIRTRSEKPRTPDALAWDRLTAALALADRHRAEEAEAAFAEVERSARERHRTELTSLVHLRRVRARLAAEDYDGALADARAAVSIESRLDAKSLATALAYQMLGLTQNRREDLDAAESALARALAIQTAAAPDSLALASTLNLLGVSAMLRGELDRAEPYLRTAFETNLSKLPDSRGTAALLMNLGVVARGRGLLDDSERYAKRALALFRKNEPESSRVPDSIVNLANIKLSRGDYQAAERLLRSALAIYREQTPNGPSEATTWSGLGDVLFHRGDAVAAEESYSKALELTKELAPGSPHEARLYTNLIEPALARGAIDRADRYVARAIAIQRRAAPGSAPLAFNLVAAARIALSRGDRHAARLEVREAVAMTERLGPTLDAAIVSSRAAAVERDLGDLAAAERDARRSLALQERLAPGTDNHVETLGILAGLAERAGRAAEAREIVERALGLLEGSLDRLGGSDRDRTRVRQQFAPLYRSALALELAAGDSAEAFHTLERFRARTLLELIAERDLSLPSDLPRELGAEQRRIDAELTQRDAQIAGLDPVREATRLDRLLTRRGRLLEERERLRERIRVASPRYAGLTAPVPLDLAAARRTLDPATLWLDFALGTPTSHLFLLFPVGFPGAPPDGLAVLPIAASEAEIGRDVAILRSLSLAGARAEDTRAFRAAAERLADRLLGPARPWLERAERLVISPDGALATLPFAALGIPGPQDGYLVERWPSSTVLSATLAAELRRQAGERRGERIDLVAFGDPLYPPGERDAALRTSSVRGGPAAPTRAGDGDRGGRPWLRFRTGLSPLPGSRREVTAIAAILHPAHAFLGAEATEQRFLDEAPRGRIVHFAGHALLDPRFPLDSGLALTPPGQARRPGDDGLLEAWEIFERLRIGADLVTLSACETRLGAEAQGEGLLGLTRAFHYAGARAVLASLWSVSDRSTADLMERFYGHLGRGEPADRALALAQRELIASERSHPYHWASFALDGDGRVAAR